MDIVIGAGATGLAYAAFCKNPYLIIEAESSPGGYCKTIKQDGFVWDYSGHFFHFRNPEMERLACGNLPEGSLLRCKKHTQILYKDEYVDFPFQKNIHQLSKEEFIECLYDLFFTNQDTISNFKEMLYSKFGTAIAEKFLIPYNEKLYACDLNKLDQNAMGRFFPYADKEEIIGNFKCSDNGSYNSTFVYPRGGAVEYINSLLTHTDATKLHLNERVLKIDAATKTVITDYGKYDFDNIVSSIPLPTLLKICGISYAPDVFTWNKVLVFNLGFDRKGKEHTNNWIYIPDREVSFYRVGYYDNIFGDERMSLYVELGFEAEADIDIDKMKAKVMNDLIKVGIVSPEQRLVASCSVIMNPAYVHISEIAIEKAKQYKEQLKVYNIYSVGRYGSWTYCSIEDGMLEAKELSLGLNP